MCILLYEKVSWARIMFCLLPLLLLAVVIAAVGRVVVFPVGMCRIVCCSPARQSVASIPSGHRMVLDQPLSSVVKIGFLICTFYVLEYDTLSIGFLLWVLLTLLDISLMSPLGQLTRYATLFYFVFSCLLYK